MVYDLYREYRFKFYLNANHYIVIAGKEGKVHPHTWEFMVNIAIDRQDFVQFDAYEKAIDVFFDQYQNTVLNEKEPFGEITPTLENIAEYFVVQIKEIVENLGGHLMQLEGSETPTRSYVINLENQKDYVEHMKQHSQETMEKILDRVLDEIV